MESSVAERHDRDPKPERPEARVQIFCREGWIVLEALLGGFLVGDEGGVLISQGAFQGFV